MKTTLLGLLGLFAMACGGDDDDNTGDTDEVPTGCSEIPCFLEVKGTIDFSNSDDREYTIIMVGDGNRVTCEDVPIPFEQESFECSGKGSIEMGEDPYKPEVRLFINDIDATLPSTVRVEVFYWLREVEVTKINADFDVMDGDVYYPNGEECPPTCMNGVLDVLVDSPEEE